MKRTPSQDRNPGLTSPENSYFNQYDDALRQKDVLRTYSMHERKTPELPEAAPSAAKHPYPFGSFQARLTEELLQDAPGLSVTEEPSKSARPPEVTAETHPNRPEGHEGQRVADAIAAKIATYGKYPSFRQMIARLPDPNLRSRNSGNSLLHLAVLQGGALELTALLNDKRTNLDQTNNEGLTPLQLAERTGLDAKAALIQKTAAQRAEGSQEESHAARLHMQRAAADQTKGPIR